MCLMKVRLVHSIDQSTAHLLDARFKTMSSAKKSCVSALILIFSLPVISSETMFSQCPSDRRSTTIQITSENLSLVGHVRKVVNSHSLIECSQRCLFQPWCLSVNYELGKVGGGTCELNDFGVSHQMEVSPGQLFAKRPGFVYTQVGMPPKVSSGDLLFDSACLLACLLACLFACLLIRLL